MKRLALLFALLLPKLVFGHPMLADADQNAPSAQKIYSISRIHIEYDKTHPEQIPLSKLEGAQISLFEKDGVFYGKEMPESSQVSITIDGINKSGQTMKMSDTALSVVLSTIFHQFHKMAHDWTYVYIPSTEIAENGSDVRSIGNTELTVVISTPTVARVAVDSKNEKLNKKICDHLPVSLPDPSTGYPGGFINSNLLNNYLQKLNRYNRDRRIDLEIGPADYIGETELNFVVTEERPWHLYFNANNNVPKTIHRWQESVGFVHTQVSGNDDILKLDAATDSFDQLYTFDASYESPLGSSLDTNYKVFGSYSRFTSAEFALPQNLFIGTQAIGDLEFITNIGQWSKLFLDFVGSLQYRHIHNRGHFLFGAATKNFLLPEVGLKLIKLTRENKLIASLTVQSTISDLFWDVKKNLANLGRAHPSTNWAIVQAGFYGSSYIEPWFEDSKKVECLANEIVVMAQLQNAFNYRLIPELEGILGGLYTIRGYPQSTVAGDNLYMGSFEYRFHLPQSFKPRPDTCTKIFGKKFRWAPEKAKGQADWDFVIRGFYDIGQTTANRKRQFERDHFIMGTGLGAELVMWHNIFIRADWGHALRSANGIHEGHNQFYFSSTIIF